MAKLRNFVLKLAGGLVLSVACLLLLTLVAILFVNLLAKLPEFVAYPVFCVAMFASQAVGVFVHELGHLLAARLVNFRVKELRSGVLKIDFDQGGRWSVDTSRGIFYGGHVMVHPATGPRLRFRHIVFYLGGLAANLLTAIAVYAIISLFMRPASLRSIAGGPPLGDILWLVTDHHAIAPKEPVWLIVAAIFAWLNLVICVGTLIPTTHAGIPSDGRMLLYFLTTPTRSLEQALDYGALVAEFRKTRPREWSPATLARLAAMRDVPIFQPSVDAWHYYHALDEGRIDDARRFMESALRHAGMADNPGMCYEAAYFWAQCQHDLAAANDHFARARDRPHTEPQTRLRALAAIQLLAGQFAEARETASQALEVMRDSVDPGGAIAEREWIQQIILDAERRQRDAL